MNYESKPTPSAARPAIDDEYRLLLKIVAVVCIVCLAAVLASGTVHP